MNSGYSLKATLEYVLWLGFLHQKIDCTIFHELQLHLYCFDLFEIWWGHSWILCLQKGAGLSSVLLLRPFYEAFSIPVKNKGIIQNFTSNKLKKKFEHTFAKKLIYEHVMPQLISSDILKRKWIFWMGKKKFWMRSWSLRKYKMLTRK